MGSTSVAAEIRADAPVLRPRRAVRCRVRVWDGRAAAEPPSFSVTFLEGAVWDVARIATRLELRRAHDPARARFRTDQRFTSWCDVRVWLRYLDHDDSPATTAVLYGDERGDLRRSPISIVSR